MGLKVGINVGESVMGNFVGTLDGDMVGLNSCDGMVMRLWP